MKASASNTSQQVCPYFATCAGGLERFVLEEARRRWPVVPDTCESVLGKTYFQTSKPIDAASCTPARPLLATAERLFVQLLRASPLELPAGSSAEEIDTAVAAAIQAVPAAGWRRGAELQARLTVGGLQTSCAQPSDDGQTATRFRIHVKTGGRGFRGVGAQELARAFGRAITDHVAGWELDKSGEDAVQVYVQCNEMHLLLGLAGGGRSLSVRQDVPHPGLRSTVAWATARMALGEPSRTTDGQRRRHRPLLVCDPLCGRGSLVLEVLRDWPAAQVLAGDAALGTDNSIGTLRFELRGNLQGLDVGVVVQNAQFLPYRSGSVDVILTDPPFGKQHSDARTVHVLYPQMLAEMRRVIAEDGVLCLLCPNHHWNFFQQLVLPPSVAGAAHKDTFPCGRNLAVSESHDSEMSRCWRLDAHYPVRLGPLTVHLCRLLPAMIPMPAPLLLHKSPSKAHSVGANSTAGTSSSTVTVNGRQYTKRALHARCRHLTQSAQARAETLQGSPSSPGVGAVLIAGQDGDFLRSLFSELQKVHESSKALRETKKHRRMSVMPAQQAGVWYGTNPQAPHTKCFLIGSQPFHSGAAAMSAPEMQEGVELSETERETEKERVRNRTLLIGAKAAGLEPLSLKRAVEEIFGTARLTKRQRHGE